jgi:DNA-binding CsgD family transcriptional regulator
MASGFHGLTEKEKQTLRLMGRGHDAKSMARHLGLSVHTIHERLRAARRKLSVSSSREAARLLLASEGDHPDSLGHKVLGEAGQGADPSRGAAAIDARGHRAPWIIAGALIMTFIIEFTALALLPQPASAPTHSAAPVSPAQPEIVQSARNWLAMVDAGRWDDSWRATGASFQALNTSKVWAEVSDKVRVPLGAVLSRADLSQESVPAPPAGYEMVKFRTTFANKADATETLTLVREGQAWRVVGYIID